MSSKGEVREIERHALGIEIRENTIQVPASQPPRVVDPKDKQNGLLQQDNPNEAPTAEQNTQTDEVLNECSGELKEKDWNEMEARFTAAIEKAIEIENKLLADFGKYANAFSFWAQAAGQHDDERAVKRIKTQERHVQLSEQTLEGKKQHHKQVVDAFTAALELLKQ